MDSSSNQSKTAKAAKFRKFAAGARPPIGLLATRIAESAKPATGASLSVARHLVGGLSGAGEGAVRVRRLAQMLTQLVEADEASQEHAKSANG